MTVADGITPACAGKRRLGKFALRQAGDHPRMRGEKRIGKRDAKTMQGSPPHARGKGEKHACDPHRRGITPACAGKSYRSL